MRNITRVKCVDSEGYFYLTQGEVYKVVNTTWPAIGKHYTIVNDEGARFPYPAGRFTVMTTYPNPPRVHADVIKAWADGAEVQYRHHVNTPWKRSGDTPAFAPTTLYRVKPTLDEQAIAECERKIDSATRGVVAANSVIIELKQQLKQLKNGE